MRDKYSPYFWFLKAVHLHVPNNNKNIIVTFTEAGPYLYLASGGHQMKVESTKITLGVIQLTTDLAHTAVIISCFF